MRKSKFTETQIVGMIKEAESGVPVPDALLALVERHPRWGMPKLFKRLRHQGKVWNKSVLSECITCSNLTLDEKESAVYQHAHQSR